ncbi:MAG: acetoacetate metabolism regulatory protein AtoC [Herpetosiphonaceae bacterium]|nr:MAG: acetoacetate metabolism regulatory protein AtoC [Herpetosiphonaceae bacterium]
MTKHQTNDQRRILVADDDEGISTLLHDLLTEEGYTVEVAHSGGEVFNRLQGNNFDLLLLDVRMPGSDGLAILEQLRKAGDDIPVIMITAHGTSSTAIRAMQIGAYDYLLKPFEVEEVVLLVQRVFEHQALASKVRDLEQRPFDPRERIIGSSPAMQQVYKTIGRVAASDATVLITGETGTGKELVAQTIHLNSSRRNGPLIKVNCAALPETLLESELFGHEKGAFTGAMAQRKGRFELAHNGTIFLDEVGELSPATQKKLLRVLQEREFERVGGTTTVKVNVRVLAATNIDLAEEVRKGNFREDLYYRLNVINIHMPPLRERHGDIPLLVEYFLDKYRYMAGSPATKISEEAMERLIAYDWPGNVRQLEHEIERAVILSQGKVITSEHLSLEPQTNPSMQIDLGSRLRDGTSLQSVLQEVEHWMLHEALRLSGGNTREAAERLGLSLEDLEERMRRYIKFGQPEPPLPTAA